MSYVLFDIGGTNTRVAVSEDLRSFGEVVKFKTPKTAKEGVEKITEAVAKLAKGDIRGAAGGVRGVLNGDKTEIASDGKLTGWVEEPFLKHLEKTLKTTVAMENDAAVVGLGEAVYGAGEGHEIVVYHTISTGVGGVKIENGAIDNYADGFEPGHQILDIDHTILGDDIAPTLENLVSGSAVEERMGTPPYEIPQSDAIWDQLAFFLAHGLRNTTLYWSPDMIVLGGKMITGDPRIPIDAITTYANEVLGEVVPCPLIVEAKLGDNGGIYGAMALLQHYI